MSSVSKVYIQTDDQNRIIVCEGGYTTPADLTDWVQIDEGTGDKYNLCQSHYFDGGLYTADGIPRYKLVDGAPVLRSEKEIENDRLEPMRTNKLSQLSQICNETINNGLSIQLSDGSTQSFSYSLEKGDQNNIKEMFDAVCMGAEGFVYHQNDGGCIFYSAQDVLIIYKALSMLKISNTTYYNQLKQYVNSLSNLDEIKAVEYGQELTGEYLQTYNARMQEAEAQFDLIINKLMQHKMIS